MSTWLTQITPDFRSGAALHDARDAVAMHKRVMSLFPDGLGDQPRQQAGLLYRIEETARGTVIFVQSQLKPDLDALPAGYGTARARDIDALLRWLHEGAAVRYRLAANTCLRKSRSKEVVPLRGADAEKWWLHRAPGCGLELQSLISRSPGDAVGDGLKGRVRHSLTQFDGVAAVTNPQALAAAIITGIGRGKSHGCGLLSIAPMAAA